MALFATERSWHFFAASLATLYTLVVVGCGPSKDMQNKYNDHLSRLEKLSASELATALNVLQEAKSQKKKLSPKPCSVPIAIEDKVPKVEGEIIWSIFDIDMPKEVTPLVHQVEGFLYNAREKLDEASGDDDLTWNLEEMKKMLSPEWWKYDLSIVNTELQEPKLPSSGQGGEFIPGILKGRAYLYGYKEKRVLCACDIQVVGPSKVEFTQQIRQDTRTKQSDDFSLRGRQALKEEAKLAAFATLVDYSSSTEDLKQPEKDQSETKKDDADPCEAISKQVRGLSSAIAENASQPWIEIIQRNKLPLEKEEIKKAVFAEINKQFDARSSLVDRSVNEIVQLAKCSSAAQQESKQPESKISKRNRRNKLEKILSVNLIGPSVKIVHDSWANELTKQKKGLLKTIKSQEVVINKQLKPTLDKLKNEILSLANCNG
jgi:hypothetical protein